MVGPGWTDPYRLHHRTRSAGRPRGQDLCTHLLEDYPSRLPACFPGLWTPRQPAYSLAPPSSVLPVHSWMLSLRHLQDSTSLTHRKISPITHSTSPLVPRRSRLCHRSPQVRRLYLHARCSGQILQSLQVNSPPGFTHSPRNRRGPLP